MTSTSGVNPHTLLFRFRAVPGHSPAPCLQGCCAQTLIPVQDAACSKRAEAIPGRKHNIDSGQSGPDLLLSLPPAVAGAGVVHFPDVRGLQLPFPSSYHEDRWAVLHWVCVCFQWHMGLAQCCCLRDAVTAWEQLPWCTAQHLGRRAASCCASQPSPAAHGDMPGCASSSLAAGL